MATHKVYNKANSKTVHKILHKNIQNSPVRKHVVEKSNLSQTNQTTFQYYYSLFMSEKYLQ